MRLLVLDDDRQICALVEKIAASVGYEAVSASEVGRFRDLLESYRPDVISVDLRLAGSDGIEQLRFLSEQGFTGSVILMSGFDRRVLASAQQLATSLRLDVAAGLTKPVPVAALREVLARIRDGQEPLTATRLAQALENGELSMHFQPIVEARSGGICSLEALARWKHPARGSIPPSTFIPIAERDQGLIDRLAMWIIEATIDAHAELRRDGIELPVAVNVSARNLHELDFPDRVLEILAAGDMTPDRLTIEITESATTADPVAAADILTRLRLKGFGVAIDDFGTGYSSLVALHRLPFTQIKIDGSFVRELPTSLEAQTIIKSVADLAGNLELETVAEQVETAAAAEMLRELGVTMLQGHLFGAPQPVSHLKQWLRSKVVASPSRPQARQRTYPRLV